MSSKPSFFSHLFAAFRPHRLLKPALPTTTQSSNAASPSQHLSSPRPIATSATLQQQRALSTSPRSTSPRRSGPQFGSSPPKTTYAASLTAPPSSPSRIPAAHPPSPSTQTSSPVRASPMPRRRGSNESDVFREVRKEGWWIGGSTASGEERWLRLGIVRRSGSLGRGSVDRLSL